MAGHRAGRSAGRRRSRLSGTGVTLSGHVRTWAEHDAAVGAAWMATGVFDVRDEIYLTG
jgi:osmotically-inducible protein OsmY